MRLGIHLDGQYRLLAVLLFCWSLMLTIDAGAQESGAVSFQAYWGEPSEDIQPYRWNIVAFDGKLLFDAFAQYTRLLETHPDGAGRIPQDFSQVTFSLTFEELMTPSGEKLPYRLTWPMTGLGIQRETLLRGHYRNRRVRFDWLKPNGDPDHVAFFSDNAAIVVPNVLKIPVYRATALLNQSPRQRFPVNEMVWLRSRFLNFEYDVSSLATNIQRNYPNNYGCSGWYQFRFYGYVAGFDEGISSATDLDKLPPGITLVDRITYCDGPPKDGQTIYGCAQIGGTRIAILDSAFQTQQDFEHILALHEIGHTKGFRHNELPNRVMSEGTDLATIRRSVAIDESECPAFSRYKEYASREPWE